MHNVNNLLGRLGLARLKKLSQILPKSRRTYQDAQDLAASKRKVIEKLLPSDFSWSWLYELELKQMLILNLAVMGLLDKVIQAYRAGLDMNQYFLEAATDDFEDDNDEEEWTGGHGGVYTESDLLSTTHAVQNAMRCLGIYGHYLNDLVDEVRKGGKNADDAFFKAISIDRTVLTCTPFASRHAKAEYFREKHFLLRLRKAIKGKPHDALLVHQDLRSILQLFYEMKILSELTLDEADYLFIKELKLYQDGGKDPAHSLMRFIQRWKADKESAT